MSARAASMLALALGVTLALGCGMSATELRAKSQAPEAPPQDRLSSTRPLGPTAFRSLGFDYAALPMLEPVLVEEASESPGFELVRGEGHYTLRMDGDLVAEVEVGNIRIFRETEGSKAKPRSIAINAEQVCDIQGAPRRAVWQGYVGGDRAHDELTYICYEGAFDAHACHARAERAWRVQAKAIVPGTVYAFRAGEGACSPASKPLVGHQEVMEIVAPRALWIGSTEPQSVREDDLNGSFSHFSLPVWRGGSSSAVLDVARADLPRGGDPRNVPSDTEVVSYSFDVVWPASEATPSATTFVSAIRGDQAHVGSSSKSHTRYDFE